MTAKNALSLPPNLHIANVAEWREKLFSAVQTGKDLTLKAGDTTRVDSAGLQLLIATQLAVHANGKKIKWEKVSEEFIKCVELLGAGHVLELH